MNGLGEVPRRVGDDRSEVNACHAVLRAATRGPHERLHGHAGFSSVNDGTISLPDYRALLVRLYGFYLRFERAVGADPVRTRWLERDLAWLGVDPASFPQIRLCADIPRYDSAQRRLGAQYVVEGSALGGRQLYRGLDRLLGREAIDGRRFFAGRGAGTAAAWRGYLDQLAMAGSRPADRAALVSAAIETFGVFEIWLNGWGQAS